MISILTFEILFSSSFIDVFKDDKIQILIFLKDVSPCFGAIHHLSHFQISSFCIKSIHYLFLTFQQIQLLKILALRLIFVHHIALKINFMKVKINSFVLNKIKVSWFFSIEVLK